MPNTQQRFNDRLPYESLHLLGLCSTLALLLSGAPLTSALFTRILLLPILLHRLYKVPNCEWAISRLKAEGILALFYLYYFVLRRFAQHVVGSSP
jgi:hypothetical protein